MPPSWRFSYARTRSGSESRMSETPGTEPAAGSHGEAGQASETVQVVRRTAAEHEQHEDKEHGE